MRGGFGQGVVGETYLPGTRWVELHELRRCCTVDDVAKLVKFDNTLAAHMRKVHEEVQAAVEAESSDEEEEEEDEDDDDDDEDGDEQQQQAEEEEAVAAS